MNSTKGNDTYLVLVAGQSKKVQGWKNAKHEAWQSVVNGANAAVVLWLGGERHGEVQYSVSRRNGEIQEKKG